MSFVIDLMPLPSWTMDINANLSNKFYFVWYTMLFKFEITGNYPNFISNYSNLLLSKRQC